MEEKKLISLNYSYVGGNVDENDLRGVSLKTYIGPNDSSCICGISVGDLYLTKTFDNQKYPKLDDFVKLINTVEYEKLMPNPNRSQLEDIGDIFVEYEHKGSDLVKVHNPNNNNLLNLISSFIEGYLLQDSEFKDILISALNSDKERRRGLESLINSGAKFDENEDYKLNDFVIIKNEPIEIASTPKKEDGPIDIDGLIKRIDEEIENLEEK